MIAIDHRDCGAAKIAYGEAKVATREIESECIARRSPSSASRSARSQPKLAVETGLMAIDGTIEMIG